MCPRCTYYHFWYNQGIRCNTIQYANCQWHTHINTSHSHILSLVYCVMEGQNVILSTIQQQYHSVTAARKIARTICYLEVVLYFVIV